MFGRILFYTLWPLIWIYAPLTRRVRAVIIFQGRVLLVKNWLGPGKWQLPGGGIKIGETVVEAVKRELSEELNVKTSSTTELHSGFVVQKQFGLIFRYHFVLVEILDLKKQLKTSKELTSAQWISLKHLKNVSLEVTRGLKLVSRV